MKFWRNIPRRRKVWILLGVGALLLRLVFSLWPGLTEYVYARGFFRAMRWLLDHTLALLPFPVVFLLASVLLFLLIRSVYRKRKNPQPARSPRQRIGNAISGLFSATGFVIFFFYIMWGYNYHRIPVPEALGLELRSLPPDTLKKNLYAEVEDLAALRATLSADTSALDPKVFPDEPLENLLRVSLSEALESFGYPSSLDVRAKPMFPPSLLMGVGISGIYVPFAGESYYAGDLPPTDAPFTVAHELAHANGFADEGTANFWACLACKGHPHAAIRYSGGLQYLQYMFRELRRTSGINTDSLFETLPAGIRNDLKRERNYSLSYHSWVSEAGTAVNHTYLRSQGVRDGVLSYNRIVLLMDALNRKFGNDPAKRRFLP